MSNHQTTERRDWIIVQRPGCTPEAKRPGMEADGTTDGMLRALIACTPPGTTLTVLHVTDDYDLWVEDGHERLAVLAALKSDDRRRLGRGGCTRRRK